ncbi:MAG TPA: YscO family type III secretion system apparatus protein [Ramlibacter sp.]|nr:YscO family type III secretion system apparatus protein [Ramlibacter sp.]
MSMFKELLSIKVFRESKAEIAVRKQRGVLAQAVSERDQADKTLADFRDFAVRHERGLYDDLCSRIVRLHDIEDVQLAVSGLRQSEVRHEEQLRQAEALRLKQAEQLEQDRLAHADATRMKEKFVELAQVYADEQIKELERKEDAELEEVAETRRDRADWDEQAENTP